MKKRMNEVLNLFEEDKKYIEEYQLETTTGTKKIMKTYHINAVNSRNAYINNKVEEYTSLKKAVYEEMQRRVDALMPKDTTANYTAIKERINVYKNVIKNTNEHNTIYEKLDFDKIVNNINDIDISNLSRVDLMIRRVIALFKQASIELTPDDFDYTMYSKQYMKVYFESMNKDTFKDDIIAVFNQIYWECPNITTHIKLSIRNLYKKYEKELQTYFDMTNNSLLTNNTINLPTCLEDYNKLCSILEDNERRDTYLLSYKFFNDELSIYDYLPDSPLARKHLNKLLIDKEFDQLTDEEKENLYERAKNLKYVVVELNGYNKYKAIVKDIVTRYGKKDTYKGIYQNKIKEIEKEEKERVNLCSQYNKKDPKFLFFTKKVNRDLLKVQINDAVKKLNTLHDELDDARINEMIMEKLDDTSTINDALRICVSFYGYFKNLSPKIEKSEDDFNYIKEFNELFDYVYDIDNTFVKQIKFLDNSDISDMIVDKYKLLNVNLTKEDLTDNIKQLEETIDFINLYSNISKSDISLDVIKFIVEFKKIEKNW